MARPPIIGEMRHRIRVARRERSPDADFGFVETMTQIAEVWATAYAEDEGVSWSGDATDATAPLVTHCFTVRRASYVNMPDSRTYIVWNGRRYKVLRVREDDQTGRFITLLAAAQEGTNLPDGGGWVLNDADGTLLVAYP